METTWFFDSEQANGTSQNFTVDFSPPIQLDSSRRYEIGLISADIWYSWFNITRVNNSLRYQTPHGRRRLRAPEGTHDEWKTITIPPGAYNIKDINKEIKEQIKSNGDDPDSVTIAANFNTLKSEFILKGDYHIDLAVANSIKAVLGFRAMKLTINGEHQSKSRVDITEVQSVLIRCSIVTDSIINGRSSDVIYAFTPNKPPGYLLNVHPNQIINIPVTKTSQISRVTMRITDQNDGEIDLNGERTTFFIRFREKKII